MPSHSQPTYEIVQVPLDDLRADPANPRRISNTELEALTRSISEWGLIQPILARRDDQTVIGGHQRLVAACRLGFETVPVIYLDLSLEESRLLNLALNRISGEWDNELLGRLLVDLKSVEEIDLSLSGFTEDELTKLLRSLDVRDKKEQIEDFDLDTALDAARATPRAQRAELWALGDHRLLCGDACDEGDVKRLLQGKKATLCFTDPPYNVGLGDHGGQQTNQRRRRIQNDSLPPEEWESFVRRWSRNLLSAVEGALYVCMSGKEWPLVTRVLAEEGGHWSTTIIWAKDTFTLGRSDYQRQYEPIYYGWREGSEHYWCGSRDQGDVWEIRRRQSAPIHPTMKPLELVERAIENSSRVGDPVFDPFLGSGTTLVAAERTGRVCYGIEIDLHYASVILARWEAFTGAKAVRIE